MARKAAAAAAAAAASPKHGENSGAGAEAPVVGDEAKGVPSVAFVLPVVLGAVRFSGFEWTDELLWFGQLVVVAEALLALAVLWLIKRKVEGAADVLSKQKVRAHKPAEAFGGEATLEETNMLAWELAQLSAAQKPVLIGAFVAFAIPMAMGVNQPVMLQALLIPVELVRLPLFRKYILGGAVAPAAAAPRAKAE